MRTAPMRVALWMLVFGGCGAALAEPRVTPLGEADAHGAINYSVICDDGSRHIVQCVRSDQRCGYAADEPLAGLVVSFCGGVATDVPPADDGGSSLQTAPALP